MANSFKRISIWFSEFKVIFFSFFAVLFGGLIYVLFRQTEPLFFRWFGTFNLEQWIPVIRKESLIFSAILPQWFVFSLPNALWAFAYTVIVLRIWNDSKSIIKYVWLLSIPFLVFGIEIFQLTESFSGTFCLIDLMCGAVGIILGYIIMNINNRKSYEKSNR